MALEFLIWRSKKIKDVAGEMERSMTRIDVGNIVIMLSQNPVLFIKNYFTKTPKIFCCPHKGYF